MPVQTLTLNTTQKAPVSAQPVDATGAPATNFNPALWASSNTAVAIITGNSPNGLEAVVEAVGPGNAEITVTGTQVAFGDQYSSVFNVEVVSALPVAFLFTFGAAVPK